LWRANETGCNEVAAIFLIEPSQAARDLPSSGFHARDASKFVGAPLPSGKDLVYVNTYQCSSDRGNIEESQVGVYVDPPNVTGNRTAAIDDFYELGRVAGSAETEPLAAVRWSDTVGAVSASARLLAGGGTVPTGAVGNGSASDGNGSVFTVNVDGTAPAALVGIGRFWQLVSGGIAYVDYDVKTTAYIGPVQCTLRPGTVASLATGVATCTPQNAVGGALSGFPTAESLHFIAGGKAA
jgi:hypothetical protein